MPGKRLACLLALAGASSLWFGLVPEPVSGPSEEIQADEVSHLTDSDKDGLPDLLEMVWMSDPQKKDTDGDKVDDLEEFLGFSLPWSPASRPVKKGNVLRLGVTFQIAKEGQVKNQVFWLHLAFRIASGKLSDLHALSLFAGAEGVQVSLNRFLRDVRNGFTSRILPDGSLAGVLSIRVSLGPGKDVQVPLQFLAAGLVGKKPCFSTAFLFPEGRTFAQLLPIFPGICIFAALDPMSAETQLWASNQVCTTTLEVVGVVGNELIFEVKDAKCQAFPTVRCLPSCPQRKGQVITAPDGWSLLLGN